VLELAQALKKLGQPPIFAAPEAGSNLAAAAAAAAVPLPSHKHHYNCRIHVPLVRMLPLICCWPHATAGVMIPLRAQPLVCCPYGATDHWPSLTMGLL